MDRMDEKPQSMNTTVHWFSKRCKPFSMFNSLFLLVLVFGIIGCSGSQGNFALPEGDIESGKATFELLGCVQCHSAGDVEWQGKGTENEIHLPLGGKVPRLKSYSELVTSVINPSHKIDRKYLREPYSTDGASGMLKFNEFMTVQDLVDIVSFLQEEYELDRPRDIDFYPNW